MNYLKDYVLKYKKLISVSCVLFVFLISYYRVPFLFFQQDEILGLGLFIQKGWSTILSGLGNSNITHFVPLTMGLSYFIYHFFGANYFIYNSVGLLFHSLNGYLIYLICEKTLKNKTSAIIGSLIFFSSSVASELVMWPVINLNTVSLTFALIAWLLAVDSKRIWLISILFLFSVFSVEYSIGISLFLPLLIYLNSKETIKQKISYLKPFFGTVIIYFLLRFLPIIFKNVSSLGTVEGSSINLCFVEIILLVPRYLGQLFFGQKILLSTSTFLQHLLGLERYGTAFSETNIYPILSMSIGVIFIFILAVFLNKKDIIEKNYRKNLVLGFLFIIFSALPFVLVPGGVGLSNISSRYMYFGLAGMAFFMSTVFDILKSNYSKKIYRISLLALFVLIGLSSIQNYNKADGLYRMGVQRQKILNQIITTYPNLFDKTIFFVQSDSSYYGLPEEIKTLPFQSGLGQTLLVFYSQKDKLPKEFYPGEYLWEIDSQGYYESGNRGFGFYRDFGLLKETLDKFDLESNSVVAYYWNGKLNELSDVTYEIRLKLENEQ
ncbi:MAG: hypothetical protein ACD_26C00034G0030 [uncultured bacterium]|nr:MAG: hypothetical protein ACD_26C00034G0030 [uncultured bacterium]